MNATDELREVVARLRRDCPWDRAQTPRSMRPYLLEECHEVLGALDEHDDARQREELGDLLFQVYFLARLAEERGAFDIEAVAQAIVDKMVSRHPHVYGGTDEARPEAASDPGSIAAWEGRKARPGRSRVDGVPASLPALARAHRVAEKVAAVGFDWPSMDGVIEKIDEERGELAEAIAGGDPERVAAEYGDLLLATANLGRFLGVSAEDALRQANARFERRFRGVEARAEAAGVRLDGAGMETLDAWWTAAKGDER